MPPPTGVVPLILLDGLLAPEINRNLSSFTVHVLDGEATAEVGVSGPFPGVRAILSVPTTSLAVQLAADEACFTGPITGVETRIPPTGAPPVVALFAEGKAPTDEHGPAMHMRFGSDIEWGSVRRDRDSSTARCVSIAPHLRWGSRIDLRTGDANFDGSFRVVELWYRFDTSRGFSVEFVALG